MPKIQIICTQPGIRRNGVTHPATAIYDDGHWTEQQLKAFREDKAFIVQQVTGDGLKASNEAIAAEVARLVALKADELQAGFNTAVANAVAEKLATITAASDNTIDDLGKKLDAANGTIADLQKQLEAATAAQGDGTGKTAPKK
ncbi:hypothetical protein HGP17_25450 [Rhizobium sp. P38BS-XIX]|uniref:hypothetical protein n=1 Tax=Rhizobium sp. P38BS-XIX TaxID=2726740 RepID=UPI00145742F8|nr:hypothetical protein [Rhizobium sp. P38BS-XIX]NLS00185.1 hypothetical protein [Rhizobium sp. P38BS-XIX]